MNRSVTFRCHCGNEITTTETKSPISCLVCTNFVHMVFVSDLGLVFVYTVTTNGFINKIIDNQRVRGVTRYLPPGDKVIIIPDGSPRQPSLF